MPPADSAPAAPAGLARRFAALLYEGLLLVALVFIASFLLTPLVSPGTAASGTLVVPTLAGRAVSLAALLAIAGAFYTWSWSDGRRTLPMKTWKLALVGEKGDRVSRAQALVRYLAAWTGPMAGLVAYVALSNAGLGALAWPLVFLNWLAAFVDPERQFLHDRIARTRVVATR
jgi:uncharacterized RDD family membrane protein YckC